MSSSRRAVHSFILSITAACVACHAIGAGSKAKLVGVDKDVWLKGAPWHLSITLDGGMSSNKLQDFAGACSLSFYAKGTKKECCDSIEQQLPFGTIYVTPIVNDDKAIARVDLHWSVVLAATTDTPGAGGGGKSTKTAARGVIYNEKHGGVFMTPEVFGQSVGEELVKMIREQPKD